MKKRSFLLIFVIIAAVFCLFACEGGTDTDTTDEDIDVMSPATDGTDAPDTEKTPDTDAVTDKDEYVYLAFGDSIAYGYGLLDFENERYPELLVSELSEHHRSIQHTNYAVNGDKSGDLIELLRNGLLNTDTDHIDLITVSIGANNVLSPSLSKLNEYYMMSSTDPNLAEIRIPQIYDEMLAETAAGIEQFKTDIVTIIELLRELAPDAEIVFQTVYNPYRKLDVKFDFKKATLDLSEQADALVSALNEIITSNAASLGYKVADVYAAFEAADSVVNADGFTGGAAEFAESFAAVDPHPNKAGHELIADVIIRSLGLSEEK